MVRVTALQKQLAKETEEIIILTRIATNMMRAVSSHTRSGVISLYVYKINEPEEADQRNRVS